MWTKILAFIMSILAFFGININKPVPEIEKVMTIKPITECKYLQGACTDGEYIYQAFSHHASSTKDGNYIFKIDAKTFKVAEKAALTAGHMNDITYNTEIKKIVSAQAGGAGGKVSQVDIIDPLTFEILETIDIGQNIFSIAYDSSSNVYYAGKPNGNVLVLDSNFKIKEKFSVNFENYTKQGICCRDGKLYFLLYGTKVEKPNIIRCYSVKGDFVSDYVIHDIELEPEGIFFLEDKLYVTYADKDYKTGSVYRINNFG